MSALPINQMCFFALLEPPEIRNIKKVKVNSFPGKSVLFSSVKIIQNMII